MTESYTPSTPEAGAALTVFPDLRVQLTSGSLTPAEALLIETYATEESDGLWRLDHSRTVRAVESGHRIAELHAFLTSRDDQDLPETVEGFLRTTEQRARALKQQGNAVLIECADAEIAALLATDKRTAKLCLRAGERNLVWWCRPNPSGHSTTRSTPWATACRAPDATPAGGPQRGPLVHVPRNRQDADSARDRW